MINAVHLCINSKLFDNDKIKDKINKCFSELNWKNSIYKLSDYTIIKNLSLLKIFNSNNIIKIDCSFLKRFYSHFKEKKLFKYISINSQIDYRNRHGAYKGQIYKDEDYVYPNNLIYTFNIEKYIQEIEKTTEMDLNYVISAFKILLFLTFISFLKNEKEDKIYIDESFIKKLAINIDFKVNYAIITGIEVSNILTSDKYFFEDYFFELSQLNLKKRGCYSINNLNKQSLIFRFENKQEYHCIYTEEEKKINKLKKQKRNIKRLDNFIYYLAKSNQQEHESIYGNEENIDFESLYNSEDLEEEILIQNIKKQKIKNNISIKFRRDPLNVTGKSIKIFLNIFGTKNIEKFFKLNDTNYTNKANSLLKIKLAVLHSKFNLYILEKVFQEPKEFKSIKKSTFSCDIEFIKNFMSQKTASKTKQNFLIHKSILTLVLNKMNEKAFKTFLNIFNYPQKKELIELRKSLKKKQLGVKGKAILDIYYYFITRKNSC